MGAKGGGGGGWFRFISDFLFLVDRQPLVLEPTHALERSADRPRSTWLNEIIIWSRERERERERARANPVESARGPVPKWRPPAGTHKRSRKTIGQNKNHRNKKAVHHPAKGAWFFTGFFTGFLFRFLDRVSSFLAKQNCFYRFYGVLRVFGVW